MAANPASIAEYLALLPSDRRAALETVRAEILKNLDKDFEEGMQYRMIGYYVPHRIYPPGYHCDPKQPLPFAALASQKNYMSLYLMCLYSCDDEGSDLMKWFREAWAKAGKKLDMGKCCVRFKKLEEIPLDVVGALFRRVTAKAYISACETGLADSRNAKIESGGKVRAKSESQRKATSAAKKPTRARKNPARSGKKSTR
jgi:hypothetical protein